MTSSTILFSAMIGVVVLGIAFMLWKLWSGYQADRQYARVKAGADSDVHQALQAQSFTVGTPSEFSDGDLRGHFGWLSGERAWGLRLENPTSSLRSLEGRTIPLWIVHDDDGVWVRHPNENVRLRAYNTEVSLLLPKGLKDGDRIRFGENAASPTGGSRWPAAGPLAER